MNWNEIRGSWNEIKGSLRSEWSKLTDDDVGRIQGKQEELLGALQKRYGYHAEEAKRQVESWAKSLSRRIDPDTDSRASGPTTRQH